MVIISRRAAAIERLRNYFMDKKVKLPLRQALIFIFIAVFMNFKVDGAEKKFIIGVEGVSYYPLFDFTASDVTRPSFAKELLSVFFDFYDYQYDFLVLPIKRFDKWYMAQAIDFKFPDNARWRSQAKDKLDVIYSEPILQLTSGSYMLKSKQGFKRDKVKILATIFGFYPTLWVEEIAQGKLKLWEQSSPMSVVKHVLHGHADATNINSNVIRHNLAKLNQSQALVLNKSIKYEKYAYHLSSIKHPEVIGQFNAFVARNAGLIKDLKSKYKIIDEPL
jgi:polar amino acid transport system substrate-binding protein